MSGGIKKGELVRLKSGGPRMVVEEVEDDGEYLRCRWFPETPQGEWGASLKEWFQATSLKRENNE